MTARIAFVTPSYAADRARCGLLCESLDRMAGCDFRHYILVADHDLALFQPLAGGRRVVVPDSALLPRWLKAKPRPFDRDRFIWTSINPPVWPLSGWHVQQLRKLLIARQVDEEALVMADSDSVFVRPFDESAFLQGGDLRLYVKEAAIAPGAAPRPHLAWVRQAAKLLGLPAPDFPANDYINNLVSWRRDRAIQLLDRIEAASGRETAAALGRSRTFSEYQIYGAFIDGVAGREGHFADPEPLSLTYWMGDALDERGLAGFAHRLAPRQIAVCVQSFTGTSTEVLRRYFLERASAPYDTAAETA